MRVTFPSFIIYLVTITTGQNCIDKCDPRDPPSTNNSEPCACNPLSALFGCIPSPCVPGEYSDFHYTCTCSNEARPDSCVRSRCFKENDDPDCVVMCDCRHRPPDCTRFSKPPIDDHPACGCTPEYSPIGCTLRPCTSNYRIHDEYFCECTKEFSPYFCFMSPCNK